MTIKIRTNYTMQVGFHNIETLRVRVLRRCTFDRLRGRGWFHVIDENGERFVTHGSHLLAN